MPSYSEDIDASFGKTLRVYESEQSESEKLAECLAQIDIMRELAKGVHIVRGGNLGDRLIGDLNRVANSGWLNLYEYLADNGIKPDEHFKKTLNNR